MITPTPRQAALERQAERYVSDWMPEWVGTMAGQRAAHMVVKALAAVEQAAPEGQNIPTVFPLGSMGASTQPPKGSACPYCGYATHHNRVCINQDLTDAHAAIREAAAMLACHSGYQVNAWLALPAVVAAMKEEKG